LSKVLRKGRLLDKGIPIIFPNVLIFETAMTKPEVKIAFFVLK
jgi:hypothetical protein